MSYKKYRSAINLISISIIFAYILQLLWFSKITSQIELHNEKWWIWIFYSSVMFPFIKIGLKDNCGKYAGYGLKYNYKTIL